MRREQWHLTEGLILVHFAVFFLTATTPANRLLLALVPGTVAARPWTLLTFQFLHGGMIGFFFSMIILWIMAKPLEQTWGSPRFLAFWLVSVVGAAGTALLLGQPLAGDIFMTTSLLFTFATLSPDTELLLFFVLPVKVKWLAILGGGFLLVSSFLNYGPLTGIANAAGMSAGYVFFLVTRRLPTRHKVVFQAKQVRARAVGAAKDAVAQRRNEGWDARVREAEARAAAGEPANPEDEALLAELDTARDPAVTVCAPTDFGYTADPVCRACSGYAECAARRIRMAREAAAAKDEERPPAVGE